MAVFGACCFALCVQVLCAGELVGWYRLVDSASVNLPATYRPFDMGLPWARANAGGKEGLGIGRFKPPPFLNYQV